MKKIIFAVVGSLLLLATACKKEETVRPTPVVHRQIMDGDSPDSGVDDPTKPPPHGN